jgi:hypothetical protein
MPTFSPPTDDFVSWSSDWRDGILSYLKPGPRGRNLWKLTDGTYSENQPYSMDVVEKVYYGGHIYELTSAEESALRDAGYEDYITA